MSRPLRLRWPRLAATLCAFALQCSPCAADESKTPVSQAEPPALDVLTPGEWAQVDDAIARALRWIVSQQQRDGSFPTHPNGQPGVSSLAILALLSRGHLPGEGPYGDRIDQALDYVLGSQRQNGLLAREAHNLPLDRARPFHHEAGVSAVYNHAISGLALSESYAMVQSSQSSQIAAVIRKALDATLRMQRWPKGRPIDEGGWRYLHPFRNVDSDLSLVGWQLQFLRSAKNAGFSVPQESIDAALAYVLRNFSERHNVFLYTSNGAHLSRGVAGAGILALAHAGLHHRREAILSANWILRYPFDEYNQLVRFPTGSRKDRYHYGVFHCTQAMYQIGGNHWAAFFPRTAGTLLRHQHRDGSWEAEKNRDETEYGRIYTTSLVVLALGAPNQILPVYQR